MLDTETRECEATGMKAAAPGRAGGEPVAALPAGDDSAAETPAAASGRAGCGVLVGTLMLLAPGDGTPWVRLPDALNGRLAPAGSVIDLLPVHVGRPVVLVFETDDPGRPIIMGVVRAPRQPLGSDRALAVQVDGETLTIEADRQLTLRCGKASITLTRAGKVLIKGEYVSSRSSGLIRLRGGAIHLN